MTINVRNVTVAEISKTYGACVKNFNEDRSMLSAAKCSSMSLVARNIKYMRIFVGGFHRKGGVKYNKCKRLRTWSVFLALLGACRCMRAVVLATHSYWLRSKSTSDHSINALN